jgi:L-seryl-tRNA(Ser) seleniumtransferase
LVLAGSGCTRSDRKPLLKNVKLSPEHINLIILNPYRELGVRRVINACSTATHLGGSTVDPKVMDAMKNAASQYVIMMELQDQASKEIAELVGSEAAMITAGATSSLQLGAAACLLRGSGLEDHSIKPYERLQPIDGPWKSLIQKLPDTTRMRSEVILQRTHKNPYEFAYTSIGCKITYAGNDEGCTVKELEDAITEDTCLIAFSAHRESSGVSLEETVKISRKQDIPVLVDAAGSVLPRSNLKKFARSGADLVAVSGGKQIKGPNDTGILYGRKDLIEMAKLQSSPFNGLGRGMKVDRTQMVGLLVALRLFLDVTPEEENAEFVSWRDRAHWTAHELKRVKGITKAEVEAPEPWNVRTMVTFDGSISARDLAFGLRERDPSIWVETNMTGKRDNRIGIAFDCLNEGEEMEIVESLRAELG